MRFTKRKTALASILSVGLAGMAIAGFLLLGPPQLLARSESPAFCASCHVMEEQHGAWSHAGAHRRIRCVGCHLPNNDFVTHYTWKSIDGLKDFVYFHTGMVSERIALTGHGAKVLQSNCIRCHGEAVSMMDTTRECWSCHRQLRHRLTGVVASR